MAIGRKKKCIKRNEPPTPPTRHGTSYPPTHPHTHQKQDNPHPQHTHIHTHYWTPQTHTHSNWITGIPSTRTIRTGTTLLHNPPPNHTTRAPPPLTSVLATEAESHFFSLRRQLQRALAMPQGHSGRLMQMKTASQREGSCPDILCICRGQPS